MCRILVVLLSVFLVGCASIPLGTLLEFRSFDEQDFIDINPSVIRAKIHLDQPVRIDPSQTLMTLRLETSKGVISDQFSLRLLAENTIPAEQGLFFDTAAKSEYLLALDDDALASFKRVQSEINNQQSGKFRLAVSTDLEGVPRSVDTIQFSIFIKLKEESNYITLVDEAELEIITKDGASETVGDG